MDSKERSTENKQLDKKKSETTNVYKSKKSNGNHSKTQSSQKQRKKKSWRYWDISENADKNTMATVVLPTRKSSIKNNETAEDFSKDVESTFQTPIAGDAITSIEIFKDDSADTVLLLESSDDDEVVEIALPPKPTIYIDSSEEDEPSTLEEKKALPDASLQNRELQIRPEKNLHGKKITQNSNERNPTCSSPVPSVVSSVSDDFIRGDCVALNISNKQQEKTFNFDFNLHGTDLMDENKNNSLIGSNKKKKQKQKTNKNLECVTEGGFAKPKNKSKTKKQSKYVDRDIPEPDVYESDSSNQILENISDTLLSVDGNDRSGTNAIPAVEPTVTSVEDNSILDISGAENDSWMTIDTSREIIEPTIDEPIVESLIIANVSGISSVDSTSTTILHDDILEIQESIYQPDLLAPGYEFSNPEVMERHILEMQKFYDQSWGGELFDHHRIMQKMSRDKSLWRIMPADKAPKRYFRGRTCNFCNLPGHRDDRCFNKLKKCYMCGREGHTEPRCPNKLCLNCGSPNFLYSGGCSRCASWARMSCNICHGRGHPATACPDTWRRYHRTVKHDGTLVQFRKIKKSAELSCSGCTRQGHSVQSCTQFIKFSRLPIATAYIQQYVPLYEPPAEKPIDRREPSNLSTRRIGKSFQSEKSTVIAPAESVDVQKFKSDVMQITMKNNLVSTNTTQKTNSLPKRARQGTILADAPATKKRCLSDNVSSNTSTPHGSRAPNFSPGVCLLGTPKSKPYQSSRSSSISETETDTAHTPVTSFETPLPKVLGKRKLELVETVLSGRSVDNENTIPLLSYTEDAQLIRKPNNTPGKVDSPLVQDNRVSNSDDVIRNHYIHITQKEYNTLNSIQGSEYINVLKTKYKVKTIYLSPPNSEKPLYEITFEGNHHPTLKQWINEDVLSWVQAHSKSKQFGKNNKPNAKSERPPCEAVLSNSSLVCNLPKKRKILLELLLREMDGLRNDLGDPKAIHRELLYLEKHHATLLKEKSISHQKMSNSRQKINKHLKALNMILLGQAGLADGAKQLNALYSITDQLQAGNNEIVADDLRRKAAHHYSILFSAVSRTDYPDLISKYYLYRNDRSVQKVGNKMTNNQKQKCKEKQFRCEAINQIPPLQIQHREKNFNREILNKVGFCTSQLRMMRVTSAPQNLYIRNYLGQLHFIWQHLRNRTYSNQEEVQKHADHLISEVLAFLNSAH